MSQFDKLLQRIRELDRGLRFDELRKVLEKYGYVMNKPSGGSSHHSFRKKGRSTITIPKDSTIKRAYIEMVRDVVEGESEDNEDD